MPPNQQGQNAEKKQAAINSSLQRSTSRQLTDCNRHSRCSCRHYTVNTSNNLTAVKNQIKLHHNKLNLIQKPYNDVIHASRSSGEYDTTVQNYRAY